jgi:hypothetical protein
LSLSDFSSFCLCEGVIHLTYCRPSISDGMSGGISLPKYTRISILELLAGFPMDQSPALVVSIDVGSW